MFKTSKRARHIMALVLSVAMIVSAVFVPGAIITDAADPVDHLGSNLYVSDNFEYGTDYRVDDIWETVLYTGTGATDGASLEDITADTEVVVDPTDENNHVMKTGKTESKYSLLLKMKDDYLSTDRQIKKISCKIYIASNLGGGSADKGITPISFYVGNAYSSAETQYNTSVCNYIGEKFVIARSQLSQTIWANNIGSGDYAAISAGWNTFSIEYIYSDTKLTGVAITVNGKTRTASWGTGWAPLNDLSATGFSYGFMLNNNNVYIDDVAYSYNTKGDDTAEILADGFRREHEEALALTTSTAEKADIEIVNNALAAYKALPSDAQALLTTEKDTLNNIIRTVMGADIDAEILTATDGLFMDDFEYSNDVTPAYIYDVVAKDSSTTLDTTVKGNVAADPSGASNNVLHITATATPYLQNYLLNDTYYPTDRQLEKFSFKYYTDSNSSDNNTAVVLYNGVGTDDATHQVLMVLRGSNNTPGFVVDGTVLWYFDSTFTLPSSTWTTFEIEYGYADGHLNSLNMKMIYGDTELTNNFGDLSNYGNGLGKMADTGFKVGFCAGKGTNAYIDDFTLTCGESNKPSLAVVDLITAIGKVTKTQACLDKIVAAETAYAALTETQKGWVTNYATLTAARATYEDMVANEDVYAVIDLIDAIGTVTATDACLEKIEAAEDAYAALTSAKQAKVSNYATLTAARDTYYNLKYGFTAKTVKDISGVISSDYMFDVSSNIYTFSADVKMTANTSGANYTQAPTFVYFKDTANSTQSKFDLQYRVPNTAWSIRTAGTKDLRNMGSYIDADKLQGVWVTITATYGEEIHVFSDERQFTGRYLTSIKLTNRETGELIYEYIPSGDYAQMWTSYGNNYLTNPDGADSATVQVGFSMTGASIPTEIENVVVTYRNSDVVEDLIDDIGTVENTAACLAKIEKAEGAYAVIEDQAYVDNYATLTAARASYDDMVANAPVYALIDDIDAIGTVTYDDTCKGKIEACETAYAALTTAQQALVTNYATLTAARTAYDGLKSDAAVADVIAKINAIGTVENTSACNTLIETAETAYGALTTDEQAKVTNYATLTAARALYNKINANPDVYDVEQLIAAIGTVSANDACKQKIDDAQSAYLALSGAKRALVENYATLFIAGETYNNLKYGFTIGKIVDLGLYDSLAAAADTNTLYNPVLEDGAVYYGGSNKTGILGFNVNSNINTYSLDIKLNLTQDQYDGTVTANRAKGSATYLDAAYILTWYDAANSVTNTICLQLRDVYKNDTWNTAWALKTNGQDQPQVPFEDLNDTWLTVKVTYSEDAIVTSGRGYTGKYMSNILITKRDSGDVLFDYTPSSANDYYTQYLARYGVNTASNSELTDSETVQVGLIDTGFIPMYADNFVVTYRNSDVVEDLIDAIGTVAANDTCKGKIEAAEGAYGAVADQANVSNYEVLTTARTTYDNMVAHPAVYTLIDDIAAIGTVTYDDTCKGKIEACETAYDALTEEEKALVSNYATLTEARTAYDGLKSDAAVADAIAKINAIGTVANTTACQTLIETAEAAYNALTENEKGKVTNAATLTTARSTYDDLVENADVYALIDDIAAIGTVTYDDTCKGKIEACESAYNALTSEKKAKVTNYATLTAARADYDYLKNVNTVGVIALPEILGATIRVKSSAENQNIRFTAKLGDVPAGYTVVEYGVIMIPKQLLSGKLTLDTKNIAIAKTTVSDQNDLPEDGMWVSELTGIDVSGNACGVAVCARAYVIYNDGTNNIIVYSQNNVSNPVSNMQEGVCVRSVYYIARAMAAKIIDTDEYSTAQFGAVAYTDEVTATTEDVSSTSGISGADILAFVYANRTRLSNIAAQQ